jgi:NAD(P)-dependent dehydrogenase (short-subunit alcohol dehydrogenase family)
MSKKTDYKNLNNKVVIISGGSQGIGKVMVEEFIKQKCLVYFLDIDSISAKKIINESNDENYKPTFYECDVKDKSKLESIIKDIGDKNNKIDVLINNAANDQRHKIEDVDEDFWNDRLDVNLSHAFFATKAAIPYLKKANYASVINFSSISWHLGMKDLVAYETAKAGIHGLTKSLARELGEFKIRVNAIVPGWIMTERQIDLWLTEELDKWRSEQQSLPEKIYPIDIANLALFLASEDSKMITSQFHKIDAGWMN